MRIAELSRRAGVPIPTIKYYLREGLLPPGRLTSPNQARYDEQHLDRLRLVRALVELGRLPIGTIKELLAELDAPEPDLHRALGRALTSIPHPREQSDEPALADAERETDELIARRGWRIQEHAPGRRAVAESVAALRQLSGGDLTPTLDEYAEAAERIAFAEVAAIRDLPDPETVVYRAVLSTILGESLITGLRRLAQEAASATTFGRPDPDDTADPPDGPDRASQGQADSGASGD